MRTDERLSGGNSSTTSAQQDRTAVYRGCARQFFKWESRLETKRHMGSLGDPESLEVS